MGSENGDFPMTPVGSNVSRTPFSHCNLSVHRMLGWLRRVG